VLVTGGDYQPEEVVGREWVEAAGGEVILVDLMPGHSTTRLVTRSREPAKQPGKKPAGKAKQPGKKKLPTEA
jgi:hypothetical protein